ncbi:hypothetical protein BGX38DRAFT_1146991 [Terfezia claveryi]|nr:hypothetical protein BGX38DRAFT_1146991 [Terfezia claveryi]
MLRRPSSQGVKRRQTVTEGDQGEEVEKTVLQPPHIQLSKQHATSDAARPTRKVHIDYGVALIPSSRVQSSPPPLSAGRERLHTHTASGMSNAPSNRFSLDSEDHNTHQEDGPDRMAKKPSHVGPRLRSFFTIPEQYKELTTRAASHVHYYTLFTNPMLNAEEIQQLLSVFGLSKLLQHEIAEQVKYLLLEDRFICCGDGRETHQRHFRASEITDVIFCKYFASVKMHGNFDETSFNSINKVFICLVTSAMRHCLKSWTTGVYMEPPKTGDFKYNTSISTWNAHPRKAKQSTQLAWQRIPDGMRRLAHAEEDEDHSLANSIFDVQDDEHQTSDDEQTENDLDIDE